MRLLPLPCALLFAVALPAQTGPAPFTLAAGEYPVTRLLELGSRQLRCSILVSPRLLGSLPPITLPTPIEAPAEDAWEVFANLLHDANLGLIPADRSLRLFDVVTLDGPRGRELSTCAAWKPPAAILRQPTPQVMVATLVPLLRSSPTAAVVALRAQQGPRGPRLPMSFGPTANGCAMILIGWQPQVAAAIGVIQQLDQGAAAATPVDQLQARLDALDQQVAELERRCAGSPAPGDGATKGK